MSFDRIQALAESFARGFYEHDWTCEWEVTIGDLSMEEAYAVQREVRRIREANGDLVMGYKVGCTSLAIRNQLGLSEPIYAPLYSPYVFENEEPFVLEDYPHCAIEPEFVLRTRSDLEGIDLSEAELRGGIESVQAGVELHQMVFWHGESTAQELICSGGIHAGLVVGARSVDASAVELQGERFGVEIDGEEVASATAHAIMGGPLKSLRWLINCLTREGRNLPAGSLVIPGSPVELIRVEYPCSVDVFIEGVGAARARFV